MSNKIKQFNRFLVAGLLVSVFFSSFALATPQHSYAQDAKNAACEGAQLTNCNVQNGGLTVDKVLRFALNTLSIAAGIVAVVMIIVGGFKYMTSQGDANQTAAAKNTILYAVVGVIIAVLAQVIVHFVLSRVNKT